MKVYVDELPKSCERCPFYDTKYGICDISGSRVEYFGCHSLTPLCDYTKQVRKEVIKELVDMVGDYWTVPIGKVVDCDGTEIDAFIKLADFDEIITRMMKEGDAE